MDVPLREKGVFTFGCFRLDPVRRTLSCNGSQVALTARLFDTLLYLVQHHDRLVERDELEHAVWRGRAVEDGNLQKAISALRKALETQSPGGKFIVTAPGRGFRFAIPVTFEPDGMGQVDDFLSTAQGSAPTAPLARPRSKGAIGAIAAALLTMAVAVPLFRFATMPRRPPPANDVPFVPPPHSVAVMAFSNLSGDPAQSYFSDGLAEELMDSLSHIAALRVAARQSAFSFKDRPTTISQIARTLNVGAILEGSVRRDRARLRINAQLIDGTTGYQIWSSQYDVTDGDVLIVQSEIAQAIASALQVTLAGDDVAKLTRGGSTNAVAYDCYLRGMNVLSALDRAAFPAALAEFDKAVAADPAFALGYSERAVVLLDMAYEIGDGDQAARRRLLNLALASVNKAIALEPRLAEAHAARAGLLENGLLDPEGAVADATLAVSLEPANLQSQCILAEVLMDAGRMADGVAAGEHATELDPLTPAAWEVFAYILCNAHRFDDALRSLDHVVALMGKLPPMAMGVRASIELMQGKAMAALHDCAGVGASIRQAMCRAMAYHALGRPDDARAQFALAQKEPAYSYAEGADIYAQWGDAASALECLVAAYRVRDPKLGQIRSDALLDPVRGQPAFQDLIRRISVAPVTSPP